MSLHKKISNLKDFDFYGSMGIVAELLQKDPKEMTQEEFELLRSNFMKLFFWCSNKEHEVKILEKIGEEYRNDIKSQNEELNKLKKLFKV